MNNINGKGYKLNIKYEMNEIIPEKEEEMNTPAVSRSLIQW